MAILQENWNDLIKPSTFKVESTNDSIATIVIEPLEKGFGMTLANALRRVLLTSIRGFAVTSIKIDGVFHEFDLIQGVKEDVYDIIMNIKSLLFVKDTSNPSKIFLKANKKGSIYAKDLKIENGGEILNKDLLICTLERDMELNMEMEVEYGVGYRPAPFHDDKKQIGLIYIDSVFSPVKRVSYKVSDARVGQKISYDKLELTVETNGTILPVDVVAIASKIIQSQLEVFINFDVTKLESKKDSSNYKDEINPLFFKKINELELSVRSMNCLKSEKIELIGDLVIKSEDDMLKLSNFGRKSLNEIKASLEDLDLSFDMNIPNWETLRKNKK